MTMRYNAQLTSGNLNTIVAGTTTGGATVEMGDNSRLKVKFLTALVVLLAETNTLTLSVKWQVSNDGITWVDVANGSQNAAAVVIGTGTAGADAAVTRAIPAPEAIYGWRKARIAVVNGVATGAAGDTYSLSYCYRADA